MTCIILIRTGKHSFIICVYVKCIFNLGEVDLHLHLNPDRNSIGIFVLFFVWLQLIKLAVGPFLEFRQLLYRLTVVLVTIWYTMK